MNTILSSLSLKQLQLVEDALSNDDSSSDEELIDHFIARGLTEPHARQALTYRTQYLRNIYRKGSTPILTGSQALRFNPHRRCFEPDSND